MFAINIINICAVNFLKTKSVLVFLFLLILLLSIFFKHCEQLVQALQTKLLESQQKLAVALQVDCEKDAAIAKLQGAWNSLVEHWRSVEDQRHSLSKQLQDHRVKSDQQMKQMHEVCSLISCGDCNI